MSLLVRGKSGGEVRLFDDSPSIVDSSDGFDVSVAASGRLVVGGVEVALDGSRSAIFPSDHAERFVPKRRDWASDCSATEWCNRPEGVRFRSDARIDRRIGPLAEIVAE